MESQSNNCQHPSCVGEVMDLYQCKHCGLHFCEKHIFPHSMNQQKEKGHPCPRYEAPAEYEEKGKQASKDVKVETRRREDGNEVITAETQGEIRKEEPPEPVPQYRNRNYLGIFVLLLLVALLFIYQFHLDVILFNPENWGQIIDPIKGIFETGPMPPSANNTLTTVTTTTIATTTTTATTLEKTCSSYCQSIGYSQGVCVENPADCRVRDYFYEKKGNTFCKKTNQEPDTCCCK